ncbi:putative OmpL-like beta-barrel porin-2 [Candidatus Methylobacter favarea]|uniref:Putative OmpL-like beta-barrel porin-2 n=1 Tax=Candidatus Methylobacter favarea TaxID=2707345 RepID=A0A8S0XJT9_9GAMM|nr:porin [Candidatus Methylobacter favarea]CAA9891570.1 putative OmpL-like beta-barrel porin-2 [Candidatus Methylobacter favarea]
MKNRPNHDRFKLKPLALGFALISAFGAAHAKSLTEADSLLEAMGDPNESSLMKNMGVKVGAWLNTGVTYNGNDPANKFNGPVTFGDRSAELQLNQLNLYIQRAVATEGDSWDIGGRFDVMFGTDSIFTQAYGVPAFDVNTGQPLNRGNYDLNLLNHNSRFYDLAIPQAYLEAYVPVGKGLNLKAGHFYTPIGYETVPAPDNFFYTHAYTMQYGEPFTHTGLLGNYAVDSNWAVMGGAVTGSATGGWDGNFNKQLGNWDGIAGVTWTSDDKGTSANISGTYGGTSEHSSQSWGLYSIVVKHNITDKFHMVLQHDHGYANKVLLGGVPTDAQWYGVNTHWYYDILDNLAAGIRGEWFRDQNGFRVCAPGRVSAATDNQGISYASSGNFTANCGAASYYAVTAGVNWKPVKWLNIRPNVRYDWVDAGTLAGTGPFGENKRDQFLFSTDMNINF